MLGYLDAHSLCRASMVNKQWKCLASDDIVWHNLCEQHIGRKCEKCGWGLPLLDRKRKRDGSWKRIYAERLIVERKWRKGKYEKRELSVEGKVHCLMFDEQVIVVGFGDGIICVYESKSLERLNVLEGHTMPVKGLQFDECKLLSGSLDKTVKVWDYKNGTCIRTMETQGEGVTCLHYVEHTLACGSIDGSIQVWNISTKKSTFIHCHDDWVNDVIVKCGQIISCSDDRMILVHDIKSGQCVQRLIGHMAEVECIQWMKLPNPIQFKVGQETKNVFEFLISASHDKTIKFWDGDVCVATLFGHESGIWSFRATFLRLASGSDDGTIKVWDMNNGHCTLNLQLTQVYALWMNDTRIVAGGEDGQLTILDFQG